MALLGTIFNREAREKGAKGILDPPPPPWSHDKVAKGRATDALERDHRLATPMLQRVPRAFHSWIQTELQSRIAKSLGGSTETFSARGKLCKRVLNSAHFCECRNGKSLGATSGVRRYPLSMPAGVTDTVQDSSRATSNNLSSLDPNPFKGWWIRMLYQVR